MRGVLMERRFAWDRFALASAENAVYLALAAALVAWTFRLRLALQRGLLPKVR